MIFAGLILLLSWLVRGVWVVRVCCVRHAAVPCCVFRCWIGVLLRLLLCASPAFAFFVVRMVHLGARGFFGLPCILGGVWPIWHLA